MGHLFFGATSDTQHARTDEAAVNSALEEMLFLGGALNLRLPGGELGLL